MTRSVRLLGRFMNADDEVADIICEVATASVPPSRRDVGAGGDAQISIGPTAIVLWSVEAESLAALRKGDWTHILWSGVLGQPEQMLQVRQIFVEGANVRVIV